jgi:oligoendopeptidase F
MFDQLPARAQDAYDWAWEDYQPYFEDLHARDLTEATSAAWLADYSSLYTLLSEVRARLYTAKAANTADDKARDRYFALLDVIEKMGPYENQLQQKLLDSGLEPEGFGPALREMRAQVALFREENLPLFTQLEKLGNRYDEISGSQTIDWEGETLTISQARAKLLDTDRETRQAVWERAYRRQMEDVPALNELWAEMYALRVQVAANADKADFREYMWQASGRFDYTPADNEQFLASIREVVVPAMQRLTTRRKEQLGVDTLRPWDMAVDPTGKPALSPFDEAEALIAGGRRIFDQLDPELAAYYAAMQDNHLLDLDNRPNKAPGGYMTSLPLSEQALIFMNAVGIHDDVQTLLHESGHAFHTYESYKLSHYLQMDYPIEFAEVASMSMELLAAPYLCPRRRAASTPSPTQPAPAPSTLRRVSGSGVTCRWWTASSTGPTPTRTRQPTPPPAMQRGPTCGTPTYQA